MYVDFLTLYLTWEASLANMKNKRTLLFRVGGGTDPRKPGNHQVIEKVLI